MYARELHTILNLNRSVTGIALLNDRLYFSHRGNPRLAVYCPVTFQFQQYLNCLCQSCGNQTGILQCNCYPEPEEYTTELQHIVACNINNCLYASVQDTHFGNRICKVAVGQNNTLSSWSVVGVPLGLSVTSSQNVLAALNNNYLTEYSPDGQLIREISLQTAGITAPVHAVQLQNDQFGVTHHGPKHQFSIVSSDGQLLRSYCGNAGDMNEPNGIAVDERGRIFVADQNNNRILVMDSKTLSAYPLPLPTGCQLNGPYSIHYDAASDCELKAPYCIHFASNRLYIGDCNDNRIVCCQL